MATSGLDRGESGGINWSSSDGGRFAAVQRSGLGGPGPSAFRRGGEIMLRCGFKVVGNEGQDCLAWASFGRV